MGVWGWEGVFVGPVEVCVWRFWCVVLMCTCQLPFGFIVLSGVGIAAGMLVGVA